MGRERVDPHLGLGSVELDLEDHRHRVAVDLFDVDHDPAQRADHQPVAVGIDHRELEMADRTVEGPAVEPPLELLGDLRRHLADVANHQWTSRIRMSLPTMIIFWISVAPS